MSARGPGAFYVDVDDNGTLVLRGQLDIGTIQDLQDKIDDVTVPDVAISLETRPGNKGRRAPRPRRRALPSARRTRPAPPPPLWRFPGRGHPTRSGQAFRVSSGFTPNAAGHHRTMSASRPGRSEPTSASIPWNPIPDKAGLRRRKG
jgi:hypothetical protein